MQSAALRELPSKEFVQRAWARASVSLPIMVESFGGKYTARIMNIAAGGAMIESEAVLRRGATIVLSCGAIQAAGIIVWEGSGRYGLRFSPPLLQADITRGCNVRVLPQIAGNAGHE